MTHRRLGTTDRIVPAIALRTCQFSREWGRRFAQPEVDLLLRRAAELPPRVPLARLALARWPSAPRGRRGDSRRKTIAQLQSSAAAALYPRSDAHPLSDG
jgi:hypothetical protein